MRRFAEQQGGEVIQVSRAEVCVIACAELFRDAGEIMVSPMTTVVSIRARLARLTFAPDILLTDGEAQLLADTRRSAHQGRSRVGCRSAGLRDLTWGRRHVVMGANRVDHTATRTCPRSDRCST